MKVALCQINTTVGDFAGNRALIENAAREAQRGGAQLAVFPELAVCGYPPEDLLLRPGFLAAHDRALQLLATSLPPDLCVLVGCLAPNEVGGHVGRGLFNAAALIEEGLVRIVARKSLLPTYDIFDEHRYFEPWLKPEENIITFSGCRIGVTICEDAWNDEEFFDERLYELDPVERLAAAGADILVNLSASPWGRARGDEGEGKEAFRFRMLQAAVERHGIPMLFVNQVGGNVGNQFDGGSVAIKPTGIAAQPVYFAESIQVIDTGDEWTEAHELLDIREMQYRAIVQGIRDYAEKFGFKKAVIGLSGGIDSALVATLAADALGAEHVTGIGMPSHYSSGHSVSDAEALTQNLGIAYHQIPIGGLQDAFGTALADVFEGLEAGVAEENLQARARGVLLMAYSNKFGDMLLTTGNKSEAAVGYCTLYGDMNGALAPIADLWKTEVFALSRYINRDGVRIPVNTIEKPPSAELRPDQLDSDSLPAYEDLDPMLRHLIEDEMPVLEVAERTGMDAALVAEMFRKVQQTEFKRFQSAPTVRVTERCWGGRRVPVSHRFLSE